MPEENEDQETQDDGAKPADEGMNTDAGKRALAAEREKRKALERQIAELRPLAEAAQAAEDAKKDAVQKLQEANQKLEGEIAKANARADRLQVAIDKGLTAAQTKRLQGDTIDELAADADEILESWGGPKGETPGTPPGGRPKEDLKPGGSDGAPAGEQSLDQLAQLFES